MSITCKGRVAFASVYSFSNETEHHQMLEEFDKIVGLNLLKEIHINDYQINSGSGIISRTYIGKGHIPYEVYRLIVNDKRFMDITKIIEIPLQDVEEYKETSQ